MGDRAAIDRQLADQTLEECRLACAVGTDDAENLAGLYLEGHVLQRDETAVPLREAGDGNGRGQTGIRHRVIFSPTVSDPGR